jgi:glucosylglycerate hydrolase
MSGSSRRELRRDELGAAAARVLRDNDRGTMTVAAPGLYPHQWSWDAAFVAIGLAHLSVPRACVELDSLLAAQWRTGMIPHIVFSDAAGYFPGTAWWRCAELNDAAPHRPPTSGICQPPIHAIATAKILGTGRRRGGSDRDVAETFVRRSWPALYAWHRWLMTARLDPGSGLIAIVHGWESGMDNSPRWDEPYAAVEVGRLPAYRRTDVRVVGDATQRPERAEYDRYLWLVDELRRLRYDDAAVAEHGSFRVGDVFFSAILALACDVLAELAPLAGPPEERVEHLHGWAEQLRRAVAASADPAIGMARDHDVRADRWLDPSTVAGFAGLLCGGLDRVAEDALLAEFHGPRWCGAPGLVAAVPPSARAGTAGHDSRRYWRGPIWPVVVWLFSWAFERRGVAGLARQMRREGLRLVSDGTLSEYYEPYTGEPLGSATQSFTAAVTLDWLASGRAPVAEPTT